MARPDLVSDCTSCAGLCCVATSFDASNDFAFDKPAGLPCRHLKTDHRCAIHEDLARRGFRGCAAYDCFGAGQRVTSAFAHARDLAQHRDETFLVLRTVHEMLWYLTEAKRLFSPSDEELSAALTREIRALDEVATACLAAPDSVDLAIHESATRALLRRLGNTLGGRPRAERRLPVVPSNR